MTANEIIEEKVKELRQKFTDDIDGYQHPFEPFLIGALSESMKTAVEEVTLDEKEYDPMVDGSYNLAISDMEKKKNKFFTKKIRICGNESGLCIPEEGLHFMDCPMYKQKPTITR